MNQPTTPNTVEDFPPLPEKGDNGYRASSLDGGIRHQSYSAAQMHAYVLADRAQRPITASPAVPDGLVLPPVAAPVSKHSFDDAAIEDAALKHVAPAFKTLSPEVDYKETAQFARLKAFAQELASGFRAGRNAQPEQPASPTLAGSVDTPDERAKFEAWVKANFGCSDFSFARAYEQGYYNTVHSNTFGGKRQAEYAPVSMLWDVWEAARLAPAAPSGEAVYQIESALKDGLYWRDTNETVYAEHFPEHRRVLYTHPAPSSPTAPGLPAQAVPEGVTDAARDVLAERKRQVEKEGWHPDQDDDYGDGQLSMAAAMYAMQGNTPNYGPPADWPWESNWWKPTTDRRNLVKAGALILADIERLDRAQVAANKQEGK